MNQTRKKVLNKTLATISNKQLTDSDIESIFIAGITQGRIEALGIGLDKIIKSNDRLLMLLQRKNKKT
ncbi:MAG: hypothetical protein NTZ48_05570 [Candidatus Omnitrophica bacterium]|nr:hypothetical protein [Candidatus Omnitrophota bacterium]